MLEAGCCRGSNEKSAKAPHEELDKDRVNLMNDPVTRTSPKSTGHSNICEFLSRDGLRHTALPMSMIRKVDEFKWGIKWQQVHGTHYVPTHSLHQRLVRLPVAKEPNTVTLAEGQRLLQISDTSATAASRACISSSVGCSSSVSSTISEATTQAHVHVSEKHGMRGREQTSRPVRGGDRTAKRERMESTGVRFLHS
jgi:hypothetical protein